jgi:hypothetical protein
MSRTASRGPLFSGLRGSTSVSSWRLFPATSPGRPWQSASSSTPWLVWGGFVRSVAVLHATWLVNSANHLWGYRTYKTLDTSTNLWWVALLSFGEGWHNNHHAFPTSARHDLRWWELDMTYAAIRVLSVLGLVHSVKHPRITQGLCGPRRTGRVHLHNEIS